MRNKFMKNRCLFVAAAGIAVVSSAPLHAEDDVKVLTPSGPWQMDYADSSCRLSRLFGQGEDKAMFYVERSYPTASFLMLVAGQPLRPFEQFHRISYRFGPSEEVQKSDVKILTLGEFDPAVVVLSAAFLPASVDVNSGSISIIPDAERDKISSKQEEAVEWLELTAGKRTPLRLELGSMGAPMQALRTCTDDLLQQWGIDVERHKQVTRTVEPANNPALWVQPDDLTRDMMRAGKAGLVQFLLAVNEQGEPTACHIRQESDQNSYQKFVCGLLMARAKFTPALDASGKPMSSYFVSSVRIYFGG